MEILKPRVQLGHLSYKQVQGKGEAHSGSGECLFHHTLSKVRNLNKYSCLENPMDRGAQQATVYGVARSQTRLKRLSTHTHTHNVVIWASPDGASGKESAGQCRRLGREDPLEQEMATHFSILAWEIPYTEEPGELQSMGLPSVRHDRATEQASMQCILYIQRKGKSTEKNY